MCYYGTTADVVNRIMKNCLLKTIEAQGKTVNSLEKVLADGSRNTNRLAKVMSGKRRLRFREVLALEAEFEMYCDQFLKDELFRPGIHPDIEEFNNRDCDEKKIRQRLIEKLEEKEDELTEDYAYLREWYIDGDRRRVANLAIVYGVSCLCDISMHELITGRKVDIT